MIELQFHSQQPALPHQEDGYWLLTYHRTDTHPFNLPIQFALHQYNPKAQIAFNAQLMLQDASKNTLQSSGTGNSGKNAPLRKLQFLSPYPLENPQPLTLPAALHQYSKKNRQNSEKMPESTVPQAWQAVLNSFFTPKTLQTEIEKAIQATQNPLLVTAIGLKIATAVQFAQQFKPFINEHPILMLLQADPQIGFPFQPKPALIMVNELAQIAPEAIGMMPLLEDWQIPNRLLNPHFQAGCYQGTLEELLHQWQEHSSSHQWQQLALQ